MIEEIKKEFNLFKLLVFLLTVAVSIYLVQILWQFIGNFSDIIMIVVLAWLLSFIMEPVVDLVGKYSKAPKLWSAIFVYVFFAVLFAVLVFIFIPLVTVQLQALSKIIPQYLEQYPKYVQTWNNAVTNSAETLITFIPSLATIFVNITLILFMSFYLIVDKDKITEELYKLAPNSWHKNLKFVQKVINETFSSFLQIQVISGIIAGVSTWVVLRLFSVDYAASVAVLSGLLTIIPLIGPLLALAPPVFVVLVTNPDNLPQALLIFGILLLVQQIIVNAIGPKLMGRAFRLHPIIVFLSILIGYKIAGPLGAVFVVPVLGIFVIVLKQLGHYFINPETFDKI